MNPSAEAKWDKRYSAPSDPPREGPSPFLEGTAWALPSQGEALDLACGAGQDLVWLAQRGLRCTGVDLSSVGLSKARQLAQAHQVELTLHHQDVETYPLGQRRWDVIVVSHYLSRDLIPKVRRALRPGGLVLMEVLVVGTPCSPRFLAEPGELLRWFIDFRVHAWEERPRGQRTTARLAASRPR